MRRRSLLAASLTGGGGGEFYVDLYNYHPRLGEQFFRTAIFVIDGEKTWEEAAGLKDIEERSQIGIIPLPNGKGVPLIENLKKEDIAASYVSNDIYSSDKIIIGHTYKFTAG